MSGRFARRTALVIGSAAQLHVAVALAASNEQVVFTCPAVGE